MSAHPAAPGAMEGGPGAAKAVPCATALAALDAIPEGIYIVDRAGLCTFINKAALALLGYSGEEVLGRDMHALIHHTRADGSPYPEEECPLLRAPLDGRVVRLDNEVLWRKDGTFFLAEYSAAPVREGGEVVASVVTLRDRVERADARARLLVQYAVGRALANATETEVTLSRILQAIGSGFGWKFGVLWMGDAEEDELSPAASWSAPGLTAAALERQTGSLRYRRGEGMPGRVWAEGAPEAVAELDPLSPVPRQAAAAADGLRGAVGIPVKAGSETLGVIEFLDHVPIRLDEDLRSALASLGQQIGHYMQRERMERALREREAQYRFMADSIPQLVWTARPDGRLDYVNARWVRYCGLPPQAASGTSWSEVVHPEDLPAMEEGWKAALGSGEPFMVESRLRGGNGIYRWFLSRAVALRDHRGRVLRWFGTSTDVEDAKRAEGELRLSEQRFRSLVEASSAIVWTANAAGRFEVEQPGWAAFTGQALEEYQGDGWLAAVHPEDREATGAAWQKALAARAVYVVEHRLRGADGLYRPMSARAVPILDSGGGIREWVGLHMDMTERRRTDRALRESQARLRAALLASRTGTFRWDIRADSFEGDEGFERLTGLPREGAPQDVAATIATLVHPEDRERVAAEVQRIATEGGEVEMEYRILRGDGEVRWISLRGAALRDIDGRPMQMIGACVDATERRRFEDELVSAKEAAEAANLAKSQFIANMSHELRTPLSAVIGYTELIEEELEDLAPGSAPEGAEAILEDIRKIRGNARHLLGLINDVLDLSKIEAGRMEVQPEEFEVEPLLSELRDTVEALAEKKGNTLRLDLPLPLGRMYSDPMKLRQALLNLLSNAAKFTEQGSITLSARRLPGEEGDELEFSVADTGIGMTEEQLGRLFQRFSQADASTTRRFGGTGLGLALTRAFCHMLGGEIEVESRPAAGTTFTIRLPADLRTRRAGVPPAEEGTSTGGEAGTVLVIDDDAPTRDLLSRFLAREGFAARTAPDGAAGLELARSLRPVAILLDVMMPRMDGWAVLSALKADPELASIPVIMISVVQERSLAFSLGAADYLTKPVDWRRFKQTVERYRQPEPTGPALLLMEDDETRKDLRQLLDGEGWTVIEARNGTEALERLSDARPQVVLLDLQAQDPGGLPFLRALRQHPEWSSIPVIAIAEGGLTPPERARLEGQVRQIVQADEGLAEEISAELRAIVASVAAAQE